MVGLSFVGLLVYGANRDGPPKEACERLPNKPPSKMEGEDMEHWCPPKLAEKTKPLQARFGPGLDQGERTVETGDIERKLPVKPEPGTEVRAAKLSLLEGNFALITDQDDEAVCLCAKGSPLPGDVRDKCDSAWRRAHHQKAFCEPRWDRGTMPFGKLGGEVVFPIAKQRAKVLVE